MHHNIECTRTGNKGTTKNKQYANYQNKEL